MRTSILSAAFVAALAVTALSANNAQAQVVIQPTITASPYVYPVYYPSYTYAYGYANPYYSGWSYRWATPYNYGTWTWYNQSPYYTGYWSGPYYSGYWGWRGFRRW